MYSHISHAGSSSPTFEIGTPKKISGSLQITYLSYVVLPIIHECFALLAINQIG